MLGDRIPAATDSAAKAVVFLQRTREQLDATAACYRHGLQISDDELERMASKETR